jgi:hypothetical protein
MNRSWTYSTGCRCQRDPILGAHLAAVDPGTDRRFKDPRLLGEIHVTVTLKKLFVVAAIADEAGHTHRGRARPEFKSSMQN